MNEIEVALMVMAIVVFIGYGSAWVFAHYLDNTTNGHLLQYLRRKWKEWRR